LGTDNGGIASGLDCAGVCGGSAVVDGCGVCGGSGAPENYNCNGQCLAAVDCAGVCGGECSTCDCNGECGGTAEVDCADVCGGTAEVDCADVCGGTAEDTDSDGVCDVDDNCADTAANTDVNLDGCSDDQLSIFKIEGKIPNTFTISQNFPNPFNPVTSITFDVAEMGEITLIVYDLTGKEVAALVSGVYIPGRYQVEWDAVNNAGDDIVSGMYIYRYYNSEQAITRKMLYLK
jgi:hypothetical protein